MDKSRGSLAALALALLAVSTAAPVIRLGSSPALAVAFWRVSLAAIGIAILLLFSSSRTQRHPGSLLWLSGMFLGLHFWTWIASLDTISVARSVLLVSTKPMWTALMGRVFLDERVTRRGWLGIAIVVLGSGVATGGGEAGRGDLLAILGAILAAAYMVVGRHERQRWEILPFLTRVYGWAAVTLCVLLLVTRTNPLPAQSGDWAVFVFLAAVPTGIGHSLNNYSLRYLPAYVVATAITLEPWGASLLAYLIFGEKPEVLTWWAAPLVLIGVWLVVPRDTPND